MMILPNLRCCSRRTNSSFSDFTGFARVHVAGNTRNLGGSRVSAAVRAVPPYEVNSESDGTDTGESECLSSTEEAGELTREDPVEGRKASGHGIAGGKDGRDFEL